MRCKKTLVNQIDKYEEIINVKFYLKIRFNVRLFDKCEEIM